MKIIHIIGLLGAIFVVNNMQSMELPSKYLLEERLLLDEISIEEYLFALQKLGDQYAYMLRTLQMAEYINVNNEYDILIAKLISRLSLANDHIQQYGLDEEFLNIIYKAIRLDIRTRYQLLLQHIANGDATKMGKDT